MQYIHYPYDPGSAPEESVMPLNVRAHIKTMLDAHEIAAFISVPGADLRKSQIAASAQIILAPHLIFAIEPGMSASIVRVDGHRFQFDCDEQGKLSTQISVYPELPAAPRKPATAGCSM